MEENRIEDVLAAVIKEMVDKPDGVKVSMIPSTQTNVIELQVAQEDKPKVIGRQGRTADALRVVLGAIGGKRRKRYVLQIDG